tara:strand:+ start:205 stop:441 length:237 start_codon:yes stop_codon:yes gene_type:complete
MVNIIKVKTEMYILYFEIIINCGKKFTTEARVAPAPIATKSEGKAQHINVDEDVRRANNPILLELIFLLNIIIIFQFA